MNNSTQSIMQIIALVLCCAIFSVSEGARLKIRVNIDDLNNTVTTDYVANACEDKVEVQRDSLNLQQERPKLNQLGNYVKFYTSKYLKENMINVLRVAVPGMGVTTIDFLRAMRQDGCSMYIMGGAVRDLFINRVSKDIDVETDCDLSTVVQNCRYRYESPYYLPAKTYCRRNGRIAHFGTANYVAEQIDLGSTEHTFYGPVKNLEYTPNAIAYDTGSLSVVIDLSGTGIEDLCNKKIRIPIKSGGNAATERKAWADVGPPSGKKIFRYWKLRSKGFTAYDQATLDFIKAQSQTYIDYDGWMAFKKYYCGIMFGDTWVNKRTNNCWASYNNYMNNNAKAQTFKAAVTADLGMAMTLPGCGEWQNLQ